MMIEPHQATSTESRKLKKEASHELMDDRVDVYIVSEKGAKSENKTMHM